MNKVKIGISLDTSVNDRLGAICKARGQPKSSLINQVLAENIEAYEGEWVPKRRKRKTKRS